MDFYHLTRIVKRGVCLEVLYGEYNASAYYVDVCDDLIRHRIVKEPFWKRPNISFTLEVVNRFSVARGSAGWSVSVSKMPGIHRI